MTCEQCGRELAVGSWPWCPHGEPHGNAIQTNEAFIGGVVIENMGHEPVTVYSREEFAQECIKRMGYHPDERPIKHVPGDKYLINWAAGIDAQTLENARVLIERQQLSGTGKSSDPAAVKSYRGFHRDVTNDGPWVELTRSK